MNIFSNIILIITTFTVVFSVFSFSSSASTLESNNIYNNSSYVDCYLPTAHLQVSSSNVAGSAINPSRVPLYNYAGKGDEYISTYVGDVLADGYSACSLKKTFNSSSFYDVALLPPNFYGIYNKFNIDYNYSSSVVNSEYDFITFNSLTMNNVLMTHTNYNYIEFVSSQLPLSSSVGDSVLIRYSITYYDEFNESFDTYNGFTTSINSIVNDEYLLSVSLIPSDLQTVLQSHNNGEVYIKDYNLELSSFISDIYSPFSLIDNEITVRTSVSSFDFFSSYLNSIDTDIYDYAYDQGFSDALGNYTPFDSIIRSVSSFVTWEFIPGVSISSVLSIILGVVLIIAFLKFFAGG